jgi:hypothetical protein
MAFCGKCGTSMADGVAFCPKCGAPQGAVAAGVPAPAPMAGPVVAAPAASGLSENVAGLLCYLLGWLTGLIFLLVDKRPFVRFHAAQSIVVFGFLFILRLIFWFGWFGSWGPALDAAVPGHGDRVDCPDGLRLPGQDVRSTHSGGDREEHRGQSLGLGALSSPTLSTIPAPKQGGPGWDGCWCVAETETGSGF